jgi:divalent metal cation (Fe/Co/Zn/Cd) transporter
VYGLENLVDFISSVVVLWRFYAPGTLTEEREKVLRQREARAAVAISGIIVVMGLSILASAIAELRTAVTTGDEDDMEDASGLRVLVAISFLSIWIFSVMAILKLRYARKLDSESLRKDGLCSIIGVFLSLVIFVHSLIVTKVQHEEESETTTEQEQREQEQKVVWLYDAMFALLCGYMALVIGFHGIFVAKFVQGLPIASWGWWKGEDVKEDEDLETITDVLVDEESTAATKLSVEFV